MVRYDIAIAGGGPAGATAAVLLRRQGARVVLVDPGRRRPRLEGLSPRVLAILGSLGLDAEGCGPARARTATWGDLGGAPNREHLVERAAFDAGLRRQTQALGVDTLKASVTRIDPSRKALQLANGESLQAGLLIEARGRQAPVGPGRRRGPSTLAIAGWSGHREHGGAEIVARRHGWVWSAAPAAGPAWTQIVVDAAAVERGPSALHLAWKRALGSEAPPLPADPLVRAAELRLAAPELDPALLRLGDAAMAMDPLSGHGVFWALSSALAAPPLVRALLQGETELARRFYRDRLAASFWRQARIGRDFHRLAGIRSPFWAVRSAWPDDEPAHPETNRIRLSPRVVVRDGRLVEADVLVTPHDPDGVAFVHGIEIAPVVRRLGPNLLPPQTAFCTQILPNVPPARAEAVHAWLAHRGIDGRPLQQQ